MIVLDTNIVLDTFVFNDPATQSLRLALVSKKIQWTATQPMRDELERVLTYPKILARMNFYQLVAADVMSQFDGLARIMDAAPKARVTCTDPDDQKFIDLAVFLKVPLLSKDRAVLCMEKRLLALDVRTFSAIDFVV